jgi:SNF family Na+-dependent transporter
MGCVFTAEPAIFVHLKPVGIIFLILFCIVISLLALTTSHGDSDSHLEHSNANQNILRIKKNACKAIKIISHANVKVKHRVKKSLNYIGQDESDVNKNVFI